MNKSLSKISELNQLQMIMQEECQLLVRKDQRLLRRDKEQQEAQRQEEMGLHKNQLMAKLQELVEIWTTIITKLQQVMIQMLKVEAEKNLLKLLKKLWVSLISYLEHFMYLNKESAWTSHQSLVSLAISMTSKLNTSIKSQTLDNKTSGTLKLKAK